MAQDRFEELLSILVDDEITADQLDELVEMVSAAPEKLQRLRDHLMMSDRLAQYEDVLRDEQRFLASLQVRAQASEENDNFVNQVVASAMNASGESRVDGLSTTSRLDNWRWFRSGGMAGWLTASVAILLLVGLLVHQSLEEGRGERIVKVAAEGNAPAAEVAGDEAGVNDNGVAVLTRVAGLEGSATQGWQVGETIPPGAMKWDAGLLQLEFYCGATVVVEGPAEIEIVDESKVVCRSGRLRAHVPEPARGFAVLASNFELVDLGTEFGLDVASDGEAEVHVFDGKVELYDAESNRSVDSRRELNAGDALTVAHDGTSTPIQVRDEDFVTPSRLSTMTDVRRQAQLRDWRSFRDSLQADPRVVAYFPFDRNDSEDRILVGYGKDGARIEGAIVGCEWSEGRWPGKTSLQFKRPGDRVRVSVPGGARSLSYSTWLRVDGLDRLYNSLLLADSYTVNSPHWQIRQNGQMILGVRHSQSVAHDYRTEPVFNLFRLGQWMHLATVYDADQGRVTHYVNGDVSAREPLRMPASGLLTIGDATIGNWAAPTSRHRRTAVRNLNGCIDELIVFGEAIDDQQVRAIYEVGRP